VISGPAQLLGDQLSFTGVGSVSVAASQAGDSNYLAAVSVTNTFLVNAATQAPLLFAPTDPQVYNTTNVLSASGGSGTGAFSYAVVSGPGIIVNTNGLWVTNGTGQINVSATKAGDAFNSSITVTGLVNAAKAAPAMALSSSPNPSGYRDNVMFAASVGNGTGMLQFLTNQVYEGDAISLDDGSASSQLGTLPRGTNIVSAIYTGDMDYLAVTNTILQIVTNHPPVGSSVSYNRNGLNRWKVKISELLTNATDADNDVLTLSTVGASTNGISLVQLYGYLQYFNTNLVDDQFVCIVNDGFGGTAQIMDPPADCLGRAQY
jgi:hypothetical protein